MAGGCIRRDWGKRAFTLAATVVALAVGTMGTAAADMADNGIAQRRGFDRCLPTAGQMSTWWTYSPYRYVVLDMGGSSRSCGIPARDRVTTVHNQGWNFIPTWVGPQAPCAHRPDGSLYPNRFPLDQLAAQNEGIRQADLAANAALNLGLWGNTVIYHDMEAFDTAGYPASTACKEAVRGFVNGWSWELRATWAKRAGVYGSSCASRPIDWVTLPNVPDDVWLAAANNRPSVRGLPCLADGYWSYHQRLHQFTAGHDETYGGVRLFIDADCADGHVSPDAGGGVDTSCL
jgi:hypothetical protein